MGNFSEKISEVWDKHKIIIIILAVIIIGCIIAVIIVCIIYIPKKKESFSQPVNTVNINGHIIDCTPEINYMNEYIKSSQELF